MYNGKNRIYSKKCDFIIVEIVILLWNSEKIVIFWNIFLQFWINIDFCQWAVVSLSAPKFILIDHRPPRTLQRPPVGDSAHVGNRCVKPWKISNFSACVWLEKKFSPLLCKISAGAPVCSRESKRNKCGSSAQGFNAQLEFWIFR